MIRISHKGDFTKTTKFLNKVSTRPIRNILDKYGNMGVQALSVATPVDSGVTASSWTYEIEITSSGYTINWNNTNVNKNVNIALILQTGHGTRNGGYVKGIDYINPALKPVFDQLAEEAWREVTD